MRVQFLIRARDDISEIYDFRSSAHSPEVAAHIELAIRASIEMLAAHPEFAGRPTTDTPCGGGRWSEYPYTIFYTIDWGIDTVTIVRVVASPRVRDLNRVPRH